MLAIISLQKKIRLLIVHQFLFFNLFASAIENTLSELNVSEKAQTTVNAEGDGSFFVPFLTHIFNRS